MNIDSKTRTKLLSFCHRLYMRRCGKSHKRKGVKLPHMVSQMAGVAMGRQRALQWLLIEFEKPENKAIQLPKRTSTPNGIFGPGFYTSPEWRAVRFQALKASNGCCVLCGRSNRQHAVILHVDHIKPKSKFPELALVLSNLQILCEDCNLGKSNRDDTDWRTATDTDRQLDAVNWREI